MEQWREGVKGEGLKDRDRREHTWMTTVKHESGGGFEQTAAKHDNNNSMDLFQSLSWKPWYKLQSFTFFL